MIQKDIMTNVAKALGKARCKPHPCHWWLDENDESPHNLSDRLFDREMSTAVLAEYVKCVSGSKFKLSTSYAERIARLEEEILGLEEEKLKQAKEIGDFSYALYLTYAGVPEKEIRKDVRDAVKRARRVFD